MRYDKESIIGDLGLVKFGTRGWMTNRTTECPWCGKSGKWGIIFNETGQATYHCWRCPRKVSAFEFLKKIGRTDLVYKTYTVGMNEINFCPTVGLDTEYTPNWAIGDHIDDVEILPPVTLPLRLKPLVNDEYLNNRGFTSKDYTYFEPSYTESQLEQNLHNFIIFKMKIDGICVAWWARSRFTKEWHKENMDAYKRKECPLILRYRNSTNNFQELLGGYDELVQDVTKTVIIVEGIFDAVNVNNLLGLRDIDDMKCCFTFGNNVSEKQIGMLVRKGVQNVFLLYDFGTINESKESALRMRGAFNDVYISEINRPGVDPGNIDLSYLLEVLENSTNPINFFYNKFDANI